MSRPAGGPANLSDPLAQSGTVTLRRFRADDIDAFLAYRGDPEVARYQGWKEMTHEEAAGFIAAVGTEALFKPGEWSQLAVALPGTDALMGDVGIRIEADASAAEIGITLSRDAQGRGLGRATIELLTALVFEVTPVGKIWTITDARNARSLALIDRLGFAFSHTETDESATPPLVEHFYVTARSAG